MLLVLVDGDCGFCMRAGVWLAAHTDGLRVVALQSVDPREHGLTVAAVTARLHAIGPEGVTVGSAAIAAALRRGSFGMRLSAALLDAPGMRVLAQAAYSLVARFRHRLPGGTAECQLPS